MIKNKKALSTVVTTLIIILLVLVAIGIIWVVISNVVTEGSQNVDYATKCFSIDVKATTVACSGPTLCNVTLKRGAEGDDIAGIKFVFSNSTTGSSDVIDYPNNVAPLQTITVPITITGLTSNPDKVEVTAYFADDMGEERPCTTYPFSF
ncbi:MAG: hypothetical protein PVJ67_02115 [Candidatus Pacearchaeota archaeon]|jgi:hypothetical protein